jgi:hypothetical protein
MKEIAERDIGWIAHEHPLISDTDWVRAEVMFVRTRALPEGARIKVVWCEADTLEERRNGRRWRCRSPEDVLLGLEMNIYGIIRNPGFALCCSYGCT